MWHFADSAEAAWSSYCLKNLSNQLKKLGYVEFPLVGNPRSVRVGMGFLEFLLKDHSTQRVAVSDMKNISLGRGVFRFNHKDAGWFGKGNYSFSYAKLPNARLFLICLDRLVGISWS
ncbi:conserved hypothetical protein [Hyella patelloides LEGE 07179]|uniref:Uncharacterized protein n=1 Tax=Hyella patelloides LEGE 07179 TaxID=945734 RepID=A0A563VJ07_9CYAN|nr:hypothetical protein [Hyella patelloides]VEP11392.1 conserved hypothetical protein [Hyella patelloides LEGE 07179]